MRLSPEQRSLVHDAVQRNIKIARIAEVFGMSRRTVYKWAKRTFFNDHARQAKESRISVEVESSILALRSLGWGTARIRQGLWSMPPYIRESIPGLVQGTRLSRTAINNVLRKHKLNGYLNEGKAWKFFRASEPDELWQLDIKGPFTFQGKAHYFVVCVDDYSRYLVLLACLNHVPSSKEIFSLLVPLFLKHKPKKLLTDNGGQFRRKWELLCMCEEIESLFAHPYYPQDKGKVERTIRNLNEEFLLLLRRFPEWKPRLQEYVGWYNDDRIHGGVHCTPAELYT